MPSNDKSTGNAEFLFAERIEWTELPPDSKILELRTYWENLRQGDVLPSRGSIDPLEIGTSLLPWIFILDVLPQEDGLDYHYRLAGTSNVELVGRDPTGKRASDIFGSQERAFMIETFNQTVKEGAPTYWYGDIPQEIYERVRVYRGLFPLADDGKTVNKLICAAVPKYE